MLQLCTQFGTAIHHNCYKQLVLKYLFVTNFLNESRINLLRNLGEILEFESFTFAYIQSTQYSFIVIVWQWLVNLFALYVKICFLPFIFH